jgi:hypothetical protein
LEIIFFLIEINYSFFFNILKIIRGNSFVSSCSKKSTHHLKVKIKNKNKKNKIKTKK